MSGRKKTEYIRRSFETRIPGKPSETHEKYVALCFTLLTSPAWFQLSNGARNLYTFMRLQYDGINDSFNFNRAIYTKVYPLYSNRNQFYKDRDQLVEVGFIEIVEHGKNTRTKAIYKFSDKWQKQKVRPPDR